MKSAISLIVVLILVHFSTGSSFIDGVNQQPSKNSEMTKFHEWDFIKESLQGSTFRVYDMNYPPVLIPFVMIHDNSTINNSSIIAYRGTGAEVTDYLAQHYDLRIEYVNEDQFEVAEFGKAQKLDAADVDAEIMIDFRIGGDLEAVGKCRMSASNPIFYSQSYSVSLQKDNRFTKAIDRDMLRLMEHGLYDHWKKAYISSIDRCNLNASGSKGASNKSIRLIERFSAFFVVFGIGLSLSFFVFLMGWVVHLGRKIIRERSIIAV